MLDRFAEVVGVGKVYGPYSYAYAKNPCFLWQANGKKATTLIGSKLYPWLGSIKRGDWLRILGVA